MRKNCTQGVRKIGRLGLSGIVAAAARSFDQKVFEHERALARIEIAAATAARNFVGGDFLQGRLDSRHFVLSAAVRAVHRRGRKLLRRPDYDNRSRQPEGACREKNTRSKPERRMIE